MADKKRGIILLFGYGYSGSFMICQNCNHNTASFHSISNINGKISEVYLCQVCRRNLQDSVGIPDIVYNTSQFEHMASFAEFINLMNQSSKESRQTEQSHVQQKQSLTCSECGTSISKFVKSLYVGCQHCYKVFETKLLPMVESIQHGNRHIGKVPKGMESMQHLQNLEYQLRLAVQEERFEDAKNIRDQIKQLGT